MSIDFGTTNYLAFPAPQAPIVLYRLATWGAYSNLAITRERLITNIEYRDRLVMQIVTNRPSPSPWPLVAAGGAGALVMLLIVSAVK